jgi:alpha-L-fucosidase 2
MMAALTAALALTAEKNPNLNLWYTTPADQWVEALPVGNGSMGAMVFGGVGTERIQFNEDTLWTGRPHSYANEGAWRHLDELRDLLWAGKQSEAHDLGMKEFMSQPLGQMTYQDFGDLFIEFGQDEAQAYVRQLDLSQAVAQVDFRRGDSRYHREVIASFPDRVIAVNLRSSGEQMNFKVRIDPAHTSVPTSGGSRITAAGIVEEGGVKWAVQAELRTDGDVRAKDGQLVVEGATNATVLLSPATSFVSPWDISGDPVSKAAATLDRLQGTDYEEIKRRHIEDHQNLFGRLSVDLGENSEAERLSTEKRVVAFNAGADDPGLSELMCQYGRYLMIASSRPGSQPANLQGVWNDSNRPPWDSKYTCNINTEMNYWLAERGNLSECHEPLFAALDEIAQTGQEVAREHYDADGWVLHHNFDIWRGSAPINHSNHGIWVTGGAWLSQHMWWRWLYSQDREFLEDRAYPLMREASRFFLDYLVEDPRTGLLVSGPSNSPEIGGLVMGPTMDHQIIRHLLTRTAEASEILGVDEGLRRQMLDTAKRITPNRIGRHGQLQEWLEDKDDPNNKHRHVSHLWGLHPGEEITQTKTPELFAAAQKSLEMRGDGGTGWSKGWKINFWARLKDGDHAHKMIRTQLTPIGFDGVQMSGGGTYPNLFDAHPPFQIDGNFGAAAGIIEILVQDHDGFIELLPALPSHWSSGSISGVRCRGGITMSMSWEDGKLVEAKLTSSQGLPIQVLVHGDLMTLTPKIGSTVTING